MFSSAALVNVMRQRLRNGISQYELRPLRGLTHTASELTCAYWPQPHAKKSPTGHSTDGLSWSSQYIRRMQKRQLHVGVIQICWIAPAAWMSARVRVSPG